MFCALSGRSLSWNIPVFSLFISREHANLIGCHFFSHSCASSSFKNAAPKVLWEKVISRRSKELKSDPGSCPLVWAPCWKFGWRHHISSSGCGPDWCLTYSAKCCTQGLTFWCPSGEFALTHMAPHGWTITSNHSFSNLRKPFTMATRSQFWTNSTEMLLINRERKSCKG